MRLNLEGVAGIGWSAEDQEITITTASMPENRTVQITWNLADVDREDLHTLALAVYQILVSRSHAAIGKDGS